MTSCYTYPVGILDAIQRSIRALTVRDDRLKGRRFGIVRREIRREARYLTRSVKTHNWRSIRNSFNGYLAEHDNHPHNCGTGWTKKRAERRANELCSDI